MIEQDYQKNPTGSLLFRIPHSPAQVVLLHFQLRDDQFKGKSGPDGSDPYENGSILSLFINVNRPIRCCIALQVLRRVPGGHVCR
jgi:hypothetical protein